MRRGQPQPPAHLSMGAKQCTAKLGEPRALEASQPRGGDHEAMCTATPDSGACPSPSRRHADECCLATSGAHFQREQQLNDSGARIVGYDEATGRRVVLSVWTDTRACCSEADFVGAAGAASPVV